MAYDFPGKVHSCTVHEEILAFYCTKRFITIFASLALDLILRQLNLVYILNIFHNSSVLLLSFLLHHGLPRVSFLEIIRLEF
jgi:hypothetical protein